VVLFGLMHDVLAGPAVAVSTLLPFQGDTAAVRAVCDDLQRAALAVPSLVWTLASWVVRPTVGGGQGLTAMHTAFMPVGLFPTGFGVALAHSATEQLRVWGEVLGQRSATDSRAHGARSADASSTTLIRPPPRHIGSNTRLSVPNARL